MLRILFILISPVLMAGMLSCNQEGGIAFKELSPGLRYRYFEDHEGREADTNDVIVVDMVIRNQNGTVLRNTFQEGEPREARIRAEGNRTLIEDGFAMLSEGDSLEFQVHVDSLFKEEEVPAVLDSGNYVSYLIKVRKVQNRETYFSEKKSERKEEVDRIRKKIRRDARTIDAYLKEEGIQADSLSSGIRYKMIEQGSGPQAGEGDSLSIHYDARYFRGKQFSSSRDKAPYEFVLGGANVIRGMSLGLNGVPEGSRLRLYIPSPLAYGKEGLGDIVPPGKILVFDIKVLNVRKQSSFNNAPAS